MLEYGSAPNPNWYGATVGWPVRANTQMTDIVQTRLELLDDDNYPLKRIKTTMPDAELAISPPARAAKKSNFRGSGGQGMGPKRLPSRKKPVPKTPKGKSKRTKKSLPEHALEDGSITATTAPTPDEVEAHPGIGSEGFVHLESNNVDGTDAADAVMEGSHPPMPLPPTIVIDANVIESVADQDQEAEERAKRKAEKRAAKKAQKAAEKAKAKDEEYEEEEEEIPNKVMKARARTSPARAHD